MSPKYSGARRRQSAAASMNSTRWMTTQQPVACGGPEPVEKKRSSPDSEIEQNLNSLTETRTAGDPDDPEIVFTDLSPTRLEQELEAMGTPANDDTIRQMDGRTGSSPEKNSQGEGRRRVFLIAMPSLRTLHGSSNSTNHAGNPCFSVDTKAKEFQGPTVSRGPDSLQPTVRSVRSRLPELGRRGDHSAWHL